MINKKTLDAFLSGKFGEIFKRDYLENMELFRLKNNAPGASINIPFHINGELEDNEATIVVSIKVCNKEEYEKGNPRETKMFSVNNKFSFDDELSKTVLDMMGEV